MGYDGITDQAAAGFPKWTGGWSLFTPGDRRRHGHRHDRRRDDDPRGLPQRVVDGRQRLRRQQRGLALAPGRPQHRSLRHRHAAAVGDQRPRVATQSGQDRSRSPPSATTGSAAPRPATSCSPRRRRSTRTTSTRRRRSPRTKAPGAAGHARRRSPSRRPRTWASSPSALSTPPATSGRSHGGHAAGRDVAEFGAGPAARGRRARDPADRRARAAAPEPVAPLSSARARCERRSRA